MIAHYTENHNCHIKVHKRDVAPDWLQHHRKTRFAAVPKQASFMRHTS